MSVGGKFQLERVILRYCKTSGSSVGARSYLLNEINTFAAVHPTITFSLKEVPMKAPCIRGEWADGSVKVIDIKNRPPEYIGKVLERLRDAATGARRNLRDPVHTGAPSVQGVWDPSITYEGFSIRESKLKLPLE